MGRQGPRLVPFLQSGMRKKKYRNLIPEDPLGHSFSIVLPHKTKKLDEDDELIFKDWYALNGKTYVFHSKNYTDAKQAMTASLRKSDYVEKIHVNDNRLTYRILSKAEVKEKKRLKKELKKQQNERAKEEAPESDGQSSCVESGYGSGAGSPLNDFDVASPNNNLNATNGNELTEDSYVLQASSLVKTNDGELNAYSNEYNEYLKSENMDISISIEKPPAAPDTSTLFDLDSFTNIQPYVDNLTSTDYYPDNSEQLSDGLNFRECSFENPELNNSSLMGDLSFPVDSGNEFSLLDYLSVEDFGNFLLEDVSSSNYNPSLTVEDGSNNQSSEMANEQELDTRHEDASIEEWWKILEDVYNLNPVALDKKTEEQILPSPGEGIMSQSGQPPKKINVYHEQTQQPSEIQANALLDPSETQSNALLEESMQLKKFMPDPENLEDFVPLATPSTERSSKKRERNSFDEIEKESVLKLKRPREEKKGHFFSIYETCLEDMTESEKSKLHMDILKSISEIKGSRPQAVPIFVHGNETNIV